MFLFLLLLVGGILYTKYKEKLIEEQKKKNVKYKGLFY